jgi:uncharacterized repeat protein (TIGR01451 family)
MFPQFSCRDYFNRLVSCLFLACATIPWVTEANTPSQSNTPMIAAQLFNIPMHFVKNKGQTDSGVDFISRGPGYTLFLTPTQAVFALSSTRETMEHQERRRSRDPHDRMVEQTHLQMNLMGANPHAVLESIDPLPGTVNYIIGNNPEKWRLNIPTFEKVKYHEVYPGISLIYYGNQRQLEYDFVAAPEADPGRIELSFPGVKKLEVLESGDLLIHLAKGMVRWHKPIAYQSVQGSRQEIPARFVLKDTTKIGFQLASYDHTLPLVIDPILLFATYLGGSGNDYVSGISLDSNGNILVGGDTSSINFPVLSAYRSASGGGSDGFISKLNNSGTALLYSTYFGGNGTEIVEGFALDSSGNAYIAGRTDSVNLPTRNAAFSANAGFSDAFIAKVGPFGTNLLYASYLGGDGDESANAIAVDNNGNAFIAGHTFSIGTGRGPFPTFPNNAYQRNSNGGRDAFVARFNTTLSGSGSLIYSTFLGGKSDEKAYAIAVDPNGNAVVVGEVGSYPIYPTPPSSDFPRVNAYQSSFNRGNLDPLAGFSDGFVTKINPGGSALIFSTFLGGGDSDLATGVTIDSTGKIYVVGETSSTNFPVTAGAAQSFIAGGESGFPAPDIFVTVFQSTGTSLFYSTFLGGSGYESGFGLYHAALAVDRFGAIYVAGLTESTYDFPLTSGADQVEPLGPSDAFVAKINPAVSGPAGIIYSTFLGGDSDDRATGIAVDNNAVFYIAGNTTSVSNLATAGSYRRTNSGNSDVFIAKIPSPPDLSVTMVPSVEPGTVGSNMTYTIQINNNSQSTFSGLTNFIVFSTNVSFRAVSSSAGNWRTNGAQIVFNVGTLVGNASVTQSITFAPTVPVVMTNTATLTSVTTELNTNNNRTTVFSTIRGIADLRLIASRTPEPLSLTSNVTYTLTVINAGPYAARFAELTNELPNNLSFVSATSTRGDCTNFDGVVVCGFGTLSTNATATVTIVAKGTSSGIGNNLVRVKSIELDFIPDNNQVSLPATVRPLSDLSISQTGPSSGYAGNIFVYRLNITNRGPSTATSVVVTDVIPAGASYVSASNPSGSSSYTNGIATFNISSLASNATATLTIAVRPLAGGTVNNSASITSAADEPNPANNSTSMASTVTPAADLGISQTVSPGSGYITSNFTFTITVTNRGPSSATSVSLTNVVPAGFSLFNVQSPPGSSCSQTGGVITCDFGTMTNSASAILSLFAQANMEGVFTNVATVGSTITDLNPDNSAHASVIVAGNPNSPFLKITRSAGKIVLSWGTNAIGFALHSTRNLSPPSIWTPVSEPAVIVGNLYMVTNNVDGIADYYRLIRKPPSLSATRVGNRILIRWPAYEPAGTLKSTPNLLAPVTWNTVGVTPVLSGGFYYVTNPIVSPSFYRLFY